MILPGKSFFFCLRQLERAPSASWIRVYLQQNKNTTSQPIPNLHLYSEHLNHVLSRILDWTD